jgi:hypothetical protein
MATEAPLWRQLLDRAVQERGAVTVARDLGYHNHTLVSRVIHERIEASPKFQTRVLNRYNLVDCPHTGKQQARELCLTWCNTPAPTHNPASLMAWRACQRCPHRPGGGE